MAPEIRSHFVGADSTLILTSDSSRQEQQNFFEIQGLRIGGPK
jgi:hypothetical protein